MCTRTRGSITNKVEAKEMATGTKILKVASLKGKTKITTREKGTPRRPETYANRLTGEVIPLTPPTRNVEGTILVNVVRVLPNAMYVVKMDISPEDVL